jgi:hypothetical protein
VDRYSRVDKRSRVKSFQVNRLSNVDVIQPISPVIDILELKLNKLNIHIIYLPAEALRKLPTSIQ